MIKLTLRCVSVLTFIASAISTILVFASATAMQDSYPYSKEGLTVILYVVITWFLFVTALKMWKTEELDNKSYVRYAFTFLLTVFLLSSAYTGWIQSSNMTVEVLEPSQKIPVYTADYFTEEEQERENRCVDICNKVPDASRYFVYVSGRDDGNVCECYSSNDILLRMVPMD